MTIGLASDHRGYKAKKFLKDSLYKYDVIDYGTDTENSVDFPIPFLPISPVFQFVSNENDTFSNTGFT